MQKWRNWAGNQVARPDVIAEPASEDELAALVKEAATHGRRVKVVGSGHSFTACALTDGVLVKLDRMRRIVDVDHQRRLVTVEAGITLTELNEQLWALGLAMVNLGDIAYQTVAGAISTSTHGNRRHQGRPGRRRARPPHRHGDGSVVACSASEEPEVFHAARVGVGALGAVSQVTLQVDPAFHLRAVEEPMRLADVLADLDDHVDGNEHFEFFWVPHTGWALTKRNNRTTDPVGGRSRWREVRDKVLFENVAFGAAVKVGNLRPAWIPKLARLAPGAGRVEYVQRSYKVFASPRHVRFLEMEYAIGREACREALERIVAMVDEKGFLLSFPVEVRFTAPSDIPLSTAAGRPSAYLAVHVPTGQAYEPYFHAVESIADDYGGRPHWGKLHFQSHLDLAPRYPEWEAFQAVRRRLDPEGRFTNAYTDRVLGPV
jgi:L-gulono-1,4-lactone dehydrogenase